MNEISYSCHKKLSHLRYSILDLPVIWVRSPTGSCYLFCVFPNTEGSSAIHQFEASVASVRRPVIDLSSILHNSRKVNSVTWYQNTVAENRCAKTSESEHGFFVLLVKYGAIIV